LGTLGFTNSATGVWIIIFILGFDNYTCAVLLLDRAEARDRMVECGLIVIPLHGNFGNSDNLTSFGKD
jgi:hypothetical protein